MIENIKLIKLINCKNNVYDFKENLDCTHTLLIKNCTNINIFVNSKINKIIVDNSTYVNLNITQLISGIEINKSICIINPTDGYSIPIIELFKSTIYLVGELDKFHDLLIINEFSDIYNIINT
jgi:hypothetical protein